LYREGKGREKAKRVKEGKGKRGNTNYSRITGMDVQMCPYAYMQMEACESPFVFDQ